MVTAKSSWRRYLFLDDALRHCHRQTKNDADLLRHNDDECRHQIIILV